MIEKYRRMSITSRAAFWALFAGVFQKGINVLATPVFTRILTVEEYAQYTLYQSWHEIFIIFTSLCVYNYATYTAMVKYEEDRAGFISAAQTLITLLTFIGFSIYCVIHIILGEVIEFPLHIVCLMFLDMLCVSAFNLWCARERYEFHYKMMTILSIILGAMGPFIGVTLIYLIPNKGYARIYGVAVVNIIIGLAIYLYNLLKARKLFVKEYWRYILVFCLPLIPHFLSAQILTRFDRIMINEMCGPIQTGIYSLAYSLSMLMSIVSDTILKVFTPWTYQTIANNKKSELKKSTNVMVLLVALVNIILILFAPEAIKIFATNEYMEAIYIIPAVSASVYFTFLYNIFANIEYYYSETKFMALASIVAAILNVILNYIFIPRFGYIAAGYTTLISYVIYAMGHFYFMRKVSKKHVANYRFFDNRFILIISLVFTMLSLLIIFLYKYTLIRYLFIFSIIVIVLLNRAKLIQIMRDVKRKN